MSMTMERRKRRERRKEEEEGKGNSNDNDNDNDHDRRVMMRQEGKENRTIELKNQYTLVSRNKKIALEPHIL